MASGKHLYRSRNALIGGVCAGIAEYFNSDPVVVRLLTCLVAVLTAGAGAVAYLALMVILPQAPASSAPVEVKPESVRSDTYGPIPPPPPAGSPHPANTPAAPGVAAPPGAAHPAGTARVPEAALKGKSSAARSMVPQAVWLGFICLTVGLAALLGNAIEGVSWWQFWPLFVAIVGIGEVVIPGRGGYRMGQVAGGIIISSLGLLLLVMSTGIISYRSIFPILANLWPLLLIMVGFLILGKGTRFPAFYLGASLCFVLFCAAGIGWFSLPGPLESITVTVPFRSAITIDIGALIPR